MKFFIATDHAGIAIKPDVIVMLQHMGHEVIDLGPFNDERVDYPDYAHALASSVEAGECYPGIAICGSGNGINMTLNKHQGIRAALCWIPEISSLARKHNNANVLVMPGRFVSEEEAAKIMTEFFHTEFEGGRHQKRIDKIPL